MLDFFPLKNHIPLNLHKNNALYIQDIWTEHPLAAAFTQFDNTQYS